MTFLSSTLPPVCFTPEDICAAAALGPFAAPGAAWSFTPANEAERPALESFIGERFAHAYGARITRFMPSLMALRRSGALLAACGLRRAEEGTLFLETYLDGPVERVLGAAAGMPVERQQLVEVGNLAIARAGAARELITRLTRCLDHAGRVWAVFSAVPALRNNFARLGIPMVVLAPADPARLPPDERAAWGTYYDGQPQVTAVSVGASLAALTRGA